MVVKQDPVSLMTTESDPADLDRYHARRERFERNLAWFVAHAAEIYATCRGKCICVAGEELFVADTPQEVLDLARKAHPEDEGRFTRLIPRQRMARIYVHSGHVAAV